MCMKRGGNVLEGRRGIFHDSVYPIFFHFYFYGILKLEVRDILSLLPYLLGGPAFIPIMWENFTYPDQKT